MIDARLLAVVVCPQCRSPLTPQGEALACSNTGCGLVFPVHAGVPVLLVDEAQRPDGAAG